MTRAIDLTGKRFGRLVATRRTGTNWWCKCDCGKETLVIGANLRRGTTKSCGCLQKELNKTRAVKKQQRKLQEEFTGLWKLTDPFEADNIFIVGWQIVNYESPSCAECGELINEGERVVWDIRGPRDKRLIHVKHQKEAVK